jgi:opacity protein-like surface antigen
MKIALFSASLLASSLSMAAIPIDGIYSSLFGGFSYLPDNISAIHQGSHFQLASFNSGYNAGGRFGYQSGHLRYEGEVTYTAASAKSFSTNSIPFQFFGPLRHHRTVNGRTQAGFGMANVYYDFPEVVPCISPFLGIGLGFGRVQTTLNTEREFISQGFFNPALLGSGTTGTGLITPASLTPGFVTPGFSNNGIPVREFFVQRRFKGADSAFAYQGTAGFTFNYLENWALNIAYRYIGSTRLDRLGKSFQGNLASVGVVYRFNGYIYK